MNTLKFDGSLLMMLIIRTSAFDKNFSDANKYAKIMTNRRKLKQMYFKKLNK